MFHGRMTSYFDACVVVTNLCSVFGAQCATNVRISGPKVFVPCWSALWGAGQLQLPRRAAVRHAKLETALGWRG